MATTVDPTGLSKDAAWVQPRGLDMGRTGDEREDAEALIVLSFLSTSLLPSLRSKPNSR